MNARMDAAVTVDAQNAPTATWKTAQNAVSHSAHTHHRLTHEIPDTPRSGRAQRVTGVLFSVWAPFLRFSAAIRALRHLRFLPLRDQLSRTAMRVATSTKFTQRAASRSRAGIRGKVEHIVEVAGRSGTPWHVF
jgi:hypothetical protein